MVFKSVFILVVTSEKVTEVKFYQQSVSSSEMSPFIKNML